MAGLLDMFNGEEGLLGALALMSAGSAKPQRTSFAEGLLGSMQAMQQAKAGREDRAMKKQQFEAQQQMRALELQRYQQQMQEQQRKAQEAGRIQSLLQQSFMPTRSIDANAASGVTGPRSEALAAVGQMPQVNYQQLLAQGVPPEIVKALSEARNYGRDKVARTLEVRGPDGMPMIQREDDYGGVVGRNSAKPVELRLENMGGHSEAVNPFALQPGQRFQRSMTPDGAAADARARQRFDFDVRKDARDQASAGQLLETPEGYVRVGRDNQAAPITMGGKPVMGKGAAPKDLNDAQSKALLFGTRAKEADATLGKLAASGTIRPSLIKQGVEGIPGVGGMLGAGANAIFASPDQQSVEQAQRDFVNAILRRESGAVISDQEFANAQRQYFPQVGDAPQVIAQKARNRALATDLILREVPAAQRGGQPSSGGPSLDDLLKKYGG